MRIFIAINFPNDIKNKIDEIQKKMNSYCKNGYFTKKENIHLTIRFLGELSVEHIKKVIQAVDITANKINPFKISIENSGYFKRHYGNILWLGVEKGRDRLIELSKSLEKELYSIGFKDRGFKNEKKEMVPHITIGRKIEFHDDFEYVLKQVSVNLNEINVEKISIMESLRIDGRIRYIPVHESFFKIHV